MPLSRGNGPRRELSSPDPNSAQTALRFAIFWAANSTNSGLPSSIFLNRRQNGASVRTSLPEVPHKISSEVLHFRRFGTLGGSSPSCKSWYIGTSRARATATNLECVIQFPPMTISVLLADDSEIMRKTIADSLKDDPEIEVVAECDSFAQTMELASKLRPQVIVLDVHMRDERTVTPSQLKIGLIGSQLLAISIWNDDETKALAQAIGATILLDKTKLTAQLIPVIRQCASESGESTARIK
jgi:CheY-like chemotaxis protein